MPRERQEPSWRCRPSDRLIAYMPMDHMSATLGTYEVRFVLEAEAARLAEILRQGEQ